MMSAMSGPKQFPHTDKKLREKNKREGENGMPGKAGRVKGKGGAPTSKKAEGGKGAR